VQIFGGISTDDGGLFQWAVLAGLFPARRHAVERARARRASAGPITVVNGAGSTTTLRPFVVTPPDRI